MSKKPKETVGKLVLDAMERQGTSSEAVEDVRAVSEIGYSPPNPESGFITPDQESPSNSSSDFKTPPTRSAAADDDHTPDKLDSSDSKLAKAKKEISFSKLEGSDKQRRDWDHLLEGNICLGEDHSHITPKKFLIQNMKTFADAGYKYLFMEHVTQELLSEYFRAPEASMNRELEKYLKDLDAGQMSGHSDKYIKQSSSYNFTQIVIAAKKAGIKIIGLEESIEKYKGDTTKSGVNRMVTLNEYAKKIIEDTVSDYARAHIGEERPKWIAFVGSGHMNTNLGVPGIAEILECQDLFIRDIRDKEEEGIRSTSGKDFFVITAKVKDDSPVPTDSDVGLGIFPVFSSDSNQDVGIFASLVLSKRIDSDMTYVSKDKLFTEESKSATKQDSFTGGDLAEYPFASPESVQPESQSDPLLDAPMPTRSKVSASSDREDSRHKNPSSKPKKSKIKKAKVEGGIDEGRS